MVSRRRSGSSSGTTRNAGRPSGTPRFPSHDSSDQRETPENADPTLKNDPTDPIDNIDPTEAIDRIE